MKIDVLDMSWAGMPYMKYQERKMASFPRERKIAMARGTRIVSAEKYPKSKRKIPESGYSLVSSRGTKILRF